MTDSTGHQTQPNTLDVNESVQFRRQAYRSAPLMALVPIMLGVGAALVFAKPEWPMAGLGALGWLVALMLRSPVGAIIGKPAPGAPPSERTKTIMIAASGPAEEVVRVILVLLFVTHFEQALWAGLGWAGIEVVFACVNSLVLARLIGRDDNQGREVYQILVSQGLASDRTGMYAALERVSASLLHVGFTLLLAWQPLLVFATTVTHSATNLFSVRLARRSIVLTEAVVAIVAAATFFAGIALTR